MHDAEHRAIFDAWITDHKGLLFKVVRSFAQASHDQEDLFQQITLQLWESIPRYTPAVAVTTWVYRVAFYAANGWKRKEIVRSGKTTLLGDADAVLVQLKSAADPRLELLFEQLAKLGDVDRSLTVMLMDGFSYRDMSEVLGLTESNVGVRISRVKKRISEKLKLDKENEI